MTDISIFNLEMTDRSQLKPKHDANGLTVVEVQIKQYQFNRFLYQFVGAGWEWTDRLPWTNSQWQAYSEADNLHLFVAYKDGAPAGYFELQQQDEANVEIVYFGLGERFIGKGFGGYLLTQAIEKAWELPNTRRVWVHTCTLDHPSALQNYQARGFSLFRTDTEPRTNQITAD
ncbi:GNAT family N-acetyltransferase [Shewanella sp. SG44-6]|jgi:GNAT superfamily N-acetyltransferase|uniref:GNAT family N-acetyltransferase n=1 Tax=unclassified Shewanella TaxID=196818 RepID=UPI0016026FA4|nr:GNAT family N-acetyltransferase [Shewanella sp. SG44-6]MBB1389344.1 GNAT family N-acetyltransferase [Shewanella sp. SG44-6]